MAQSTVFRWTAGALVAATAAAGTAQAQDSGQESNFPARAIIADRDGERLGTAALVETPNGLLIQLDVTGLPGGGHGFHIHQTGRCESPDFKSAGGHFAPEGREHGFLNEAGPHAGDLPNVFVEEGQPTRVDVFADGLTLDTLLDDDGAALVVHATVDDYQSDPAGHAGDRLACGVVERAAAQ